MKWKGSELIWYWADCTTLPLDRTDDLDLGFSRSDSEIAISQEWGGRLTWNEKDVSHPFITIILTSVTMVGWADVRDSERGDFRHWRAVYISSYFCWSDSLFKMAFHMTDTTALHRLSLWSLIQNQSQTEKCLLVWYIHIYAVTSIAPLTNRD